METQRQDPHYRAAARRGGVEPKETRMDFDSYQKEALRTDRVPARGGDDDASSLIVPMLGLAGETGQLLSEYKKHLRDGEAHRLFKERVSEELGDLLWYIANVASKFDLLLSDVATANLAKVKQRWANERSEPLTFDAELPEGERLPRRFEVELIDITGEARQQVRILIDGKPFGAELTDNAYDPDGYRFHDVFHFAYAAVLGWSPITRALLRRKRKSRPLLDEVEDGGRAAVIEEGVAALAFDYARRHRFLDGVATLDFQLLRTVKDMTSHLEVRHCTTGDWEQAILQGFDVWRAVLAARGGRIKVDLDARRITFLDASSRQEISA
jgi:NTP pyrophosphatase (non-canonical NTP hydrolase)